jgi:hypothetical protein
MKYLESYIRKNLTTIFIVLGILSIIYYLFSSYRTQFEYIENLDNCTTLDCSKIKTNDGTTLKEDSGCIAGVPDCVPGSRCRICTASSTNPTCTGSTCVKDGDDPWATGKHIGCCSDSKEFLNTWDNDGRNYYKCCKPSGLPPVDKCAGVDCGDHGGCVDGQCICKDEYTGTKCNVPPSTNKCVGIYCPSGQVCQDGVCVSGGGISPSIQSQPTSSLQIVNNTSENPLHVFLGTRNNAWVKLDGNGTVYPAVAWGSKPELIAWDPVGASNLSEVIIPKNGYMIVKLPPDMHGKAFRVTPLKLKNNDNTPLTSTKMALSKVLHQWPILLEGGEDVVADSSAVDGINFKMKYELTSDNGSIKVMEIHKNPCEGLDKKYQLDVGCRCPASIDCNTPTCECKPGTQDCMFNNCSQKLFNIPDTLKQYIGKYDGGNPNDVVKKFINKSTNIKDGSPLRQYCDNLQSNSGDFTAYCYDYNDVDSSPWLRTPYKMKVTYMDL